MTSPKTEKWFKVKYGFAPTDIVSIKDDELEKALYAQKYGVVVQLGDKQINGKYIISIAPNFHKYTGWLDTYEPKDADDWGQIARDCPKELDEVIKMKRDRVDYLVKNNQRQLIGKNVEIPELIKIGQSETISEEAKQLVDKFKI